MKKLIGIWMCALAVALCASCNQAPHLRPGYVSPEEVIVNYHDSLRWQDYDTAKLLVSPKAMKEWEKFLEQSDGKLNIIEYKVMGLEVSNGGYTAKVKIKRKYFLFPRVESKEETFVQTWELINGRWLLSGPPF